MFGALDRAGGPRWAPLACSAAAHAGVFAAAIWIPGRALAPQPPSVYQQVLAPRARKLVWYRFNNRLPQVSPLERHGPSRQTRAEVKHPQAIVSRPPSAQRAKQLLWVPAPEIKLENDLSAPNLLAFDAPRVSPPSPRPKRFVPPEPPRPAEMAAMPEVPRLAIAPLEQRNPFAEPGRPAPRPFNPPPQAARHSASAVLTADDAPELPPALSDASLSAAVIGLTPSARPEPVLPEGSRPARFAAGPDVSPAGGNGEPVESARVLIPDLMVRSANREARPTLMARAISPTSRENLLAVTRSTLPPAPGPPAAARLVSPPDSRFEGRVVYMMAIQAPNVTSFSGSWMVWFAERERPAGAPGALHLPVALRKVDPTYAPSAVEERVQGDVRMAAVIRKDGRVAEIAVLKGCDERLERSAVAALAKWQFEPATRGGAAVDIDTIVEIPFRLEPRGGK